jgi:hypothetical protein
LLYYVHPHPKDSQRQSYFISCVAITGIQAFLIAVKWVRSPRPWECRCSQKTLVEKQQKS